MLDKDQTASLSENRGVKGCVLVHLSLVRNFQTSLSVLHSVGKSASSLD